LEAVKQMNQTRQNFAKRLRVIVALQPHRRSSALLGLLLLTSCTTIPQSFEGSPREKALTPSRDPFERSKALVAERSYEEAYKENQRILAEGKGAADVALFNMGMVSAHPFNPRKNYPRALASFRTLLNEHPQSSLREQAQLWIQLIEEQHKVAQEKQKVLEEKQKLVEERRALIRERELLNREREVLSQEREKLKYTVEKSRQVDIDIEKRRRQALTK
jgi:hypothetical protein